MSDIKSIRLGLRNLLRHAGSSTLKRALPRTWISIHAKRLQQKPAERASQLLPLLVPRSEAALDIGANVGDYTWHLRALSSEVWAFEPNPELAAWLRRCFGEKIIVRNIALGEQSTTAQLCIPKDLSGKEIPGHASIEQDFGPESHRIAVPVVPLDLLELPKVGFMKIDVEGHEFAVLRGGAALLRRDRPTILVEIEERHRANAVQTTREWLEELGYEGFFLLNDTIHPIMHFSSDRHQSLQKLGEVAYINNFIFIAREEVRKAFLRSEQPQSRQPISPTLLRTPDPGPA